MMNSSLRRAVHGFRANAALSAQMLRQLYENDTSGFIYESLPIIKENLHVPGLQYVLTLLLNNGVLLKWLCDPTVFTLEEASKIVSIVRRVDPRIDVRLISAAFPGASADAQSKLDEPTALRILDLTNGPSIHARFLPFVAQLMRHNSPKVRSKAALIVGRGNRNAKWVYRQMSEPDPRLRANAVEALWGSDTEDAKAVFYMALSDPHNRVVGNAILGLYKMGDPTSISFLLEMANHPELPFQETVVWTMGQTEDPRFVQPLASMMSTFPKLRAKILRASATIRKTADSRTSPLRVMVEKFEHDASTSTAGVKLVILTRTGTAPTLLPTQFVIWRDGVLVDEYQVENTTAQAPAAVALLLPWALDRKNHEILFDALCKGLVHRRNTDVWTVLKYRAGKKETPAAAATTGIVTQTLGLEIGVVPGEATPKTESQADSSGPAFTQHISFTNVNDRIEDMVRETGTYETSAPSVVDALTAALRVLPANRRAKAIVLALDGSAGEPLAAHTEALAAAAKKTKTVIHAIAFEPSEFGRQLTEATGGRYTPAPSTEELTDVLETLCASMAGGYQISFQCETAPASVKVQAFTATSAGEATYKP